VDVPVLPEDVLPHPVDVLLPVQVDALQVPVLAGVLPLVDVHQHQKAVPVLNVQPEELQVKEVQEVNPATGVQLQEVVELSLQHHQAGELPAEALHPKLQQHQEEVPVVHLPGALLQMKEVQYQEDQVLHEANLLRVAVNQLHHEAGVHRVAEEVPREVQLQEVHLPDAVPLLEGAQVQKEGVK
jgi:hypothetical protein